MTFALHVGNIFVLSLCICLLVCAARLEEGAVEDPYADLQDQSYETAEQHPSSGQGKCP
jgi:hypothetical protein